MLQINRNTKVFIACPANFKTGGTELLHQLVHELDKTFRHCYIYYYNATSVYPTEPSFRAYHVKFMKNIDAFDQKEHILLVPETLTEHLYRFKNIQKVIWWLSVDNYFIMLKKQKMNSLDAILNKLFCEKMFRFGPDKNKYLHLAQSQYALDYLQKHNISQYAYLSDYINPIYFEDNNRTVKEDIVLYNPKKGSEFTGKLIAHMPSVHFVPLINLTNEEVRHWLLRSKVYIDFGEHPGKDRFPREAAVCGCCILTGKKGAANNEKDIPILPEYKFSQVESNIPAIAKKITECLNNYHQVTTDFDHYRKVIIEEEEQFCNDVAKIFALRD